MNLFRRNKDKNASKSSPNTTERSLGEEKILEEEKGGKDDNKDSSPSSSLTDKLTSYTKTYLKQAQSWTAKEASDARKELQKAAGLGEKPNVIPEGEARVSGQPRAVELGWHPVAGATGKWFAEKTVIGKQIRQKIGHYPDPTQHWAVIVGDYVHQLWMDESLDIIYINEKCNRSDWHLFEVGQTRFNDQALYQASRMTIHNMREKRPAYNLITNNCQTFAVALLQAIQVGAHREFGTTFAIYQRATGKGAIRDLFATDTTADLSPEAITAAAVENHTPLTSASTSASASVSASVSALQQDERERPLPKRQQTVRFAKGLMERNTTRLDHGSSTSSSS